MGGTLPLAAQAARQDPAHTQTLPAGTGRIVEVGDWDGDSVSDYAASAPSATSSTGAPLAGVVRVFSGANGVQIGLQFQGNGIVGCTGNSGDFLGAEMCAIDDIDGDSIPEILCGRPFAFVAATPCPSLNHGGFEVFFSSGIPSFQVTSPIPGNVLGVGVTRLDPLPSGMTAFAVASGSGTEIWAVPAGSTIPMLQNVLPQSNGGRGFCSAGSPAGSSAVAIRSAADRVEIVDALSSAVLNVITGTPGEGFGESLALLDPNTLVVGVPFAGSSAGRVDVVDLASGLTLTSVPGSTNDLLGTQVAALGDFDADGDDDFAATAGGPAFVAIGDNAGNLKTNPLLPTGGGAFGIGIGRIADVHGDGFDDILVTSGAQTHLYLGGPDGQSSIFAPPCNQGGGLLPTLALSTPPVIGPVTFALTGSSPNSGSGLFVGFPQMNAVPLGGCFLHLTSSQMIFATTNGAGAWTVPVTLPTAPGFTIGFQAITSPAGGGALELSNTLSVLLGW